MFLIFDIKPYSALKLYLTHQSGDSGVWIEGEFEDGQDIAEYGVGFSYRDKLNEPWSYCASINLNRVRIESSQFEGYDRNGNGDKPNIPKSANCNP